MRDVKNGVFYRDAPRKKLYEMAFDALIKLLDEARFDFVEVQAISLCCRAKIAFLASVGLFVETTIAQLKYHPFSIYEPDNAPANVAQEVRGILSVVSSNSAYLTKCFFATFSMSMGNEKPAK